MAQAIFLRAVEGDWFHSAGEHFGQRARRGKNAEYRVNAVLVHHFHAITQYASNPKSPVLIKLCFATDANTQRRLPPAVCESMRSFPVTRKVAPCTACARLTAFNTISPPGLISALRNTAAAHHTAREAPLPAIWQMTSVCCCKNTGVLLQPPSVLRSISGVAPFCNKHYRRARVPTSGLSTSHATQYSNT